MPGQSLHLPLSRWSTAQHQKSLILKGLTWQSVAARQTQAAQSLPLCHPITLLTPSQYIDNPRLSNAGTNNADTLTTANAQLEL
jgi:hypothetical protein